jgi:hypothetical protein
MYKLLLLSKRTRVPAASYAPVGLTISSSKQHRWMVLKLPAPLMHLISCSSFNGRLQTRRQWDQKTIGTKKLWEKLAMRMQVHQCWSCTCTSNKYAHVLKHMHMWMTYSLIHMGHIHTSLSSWSCCTREWLCLRTKIWSYHSHNF